jgi:hypothetical protein
MAATVKAVAASSLVFIAFLLLRAVIEHSHKTAYLYCIQHTPRLPKGKAFTLGQIARLARVVIAPRGGTPNRARGDIGAVPSEISLNSIRFSSRSRTTRGDQLRATNPIDRPSSVPSPIICSAVRPAAVSPETNPRTNNPRPPSLIVVHRPAVRPPT